MNESPNVQPQEAGGKRPYEAPTLVKQANLQNITLFTDFGPPS
jgi:hypothetical protein